MLGRLKEKIPIIQISLLCLKIIKYKAIRKEYRLAEVMHLALHPYSATNQLWITEKSFNL